MTTTSRHTAPMNDDYMNGLRLRNAARTQSKVEQLGDRWLLHPDNASTRDQHLEFRRARAERIDTSRIEVAGFTTVRRAFDRAALLLASIGNVRFNGAPPGHGQSYVGVLPYLPAQHEGGEQ